MARRSAFAASIAALAVALMCALWRWSAGPRGPSDAANVSKTAERVESPLLIDDSKPSVASGERRLVESTGPDVVETHNGEAATQERVGSIAVVGQITIPRGFDDGRNEQFVLLIGSDGMRRTASMDAGDYRIDGLEPGDYVIAAGAWGHRSVERQISLRIDEPVHREDFELDPSWILRVRIVDSDGKDIQVRPQLDLQVIATVEPWGTGLPVELPRDARERDVSVTSRRWWTSEQANDRRIELLVPPPVYVSLAQSDWVVATQRVDDLVDEVTFTIRGDEISSLFASLDARVAFADEKRSVKGVNVSLYSDSSATSMATDVHGVVRFARLTPGHYDVYARAAGYVGERIPIDLAPGSANDLGTIVLRKGLTLGGTCVDADRRPRRVVGMLSLVEETPPYWPRLNLGLHVGDDGAFVAEGLARGRYVVDVSPRFRHAVKGGEDVEPWIAVPFLVDLTSSSLKDLVIVVHRPVLLTLHPTSVAAAGLWYRISTLEGLPCAAGLFTGEASQRAELAPGNYTLRCWRAGALVRQFPFRLGMSPTTIEIDP